MALESKNGTYLMGPYQSCDMIWPRRVLVWSFQLVFWLPPPSLQKIQHFLRYKKPVRNWLGFLNIFICTLPTLFLMQILER